MLVSWSKIYVQKQAAFVTNRECNLQNIIIHHRTKYRSRNKPQNTSGFCGDSYTFSWQTLKRSKSKEEWNHVESE